MILCADYRSPNHDERALPVTVLVMHYTGMPSGAEARERLCDPAAKVSAHYLVEEDGTVFALVNEERRAWHAGKSHWRKVADINSASIGIEIVNPGHEFGYRPFPQAQIESVIALSRGILKRHPGIEARNVVGHSDIAPARKEDPGELFPWERLAAAGVGLWPGAASLPLPSPLPEPLRTQQALARYGYGLTPGNAWGEESTQAARAFQRHFRPARLDGVWDAECEALLDRLFALV